MGSFEVPVGTATGAAAAAGVLLAAHDLDVERMEEILNPLHKDELANGLIFLAGQLAQLESRERSAQRALHTAGYTAGARV